MYLNESGEVRIHPELLVHPRGDTPTKQTRTRINTALQESLEVRQPRYGQQPNVVDLAVSWLQLAAQNANSNARQCTDTCLRVAPWLVTHTVAHFAQAPGPQELGRGLEDLPIPAHTNAGPARRPRTRSAWKDLQSGGA